MTEQSASTSPRRLARNFSWLSLQEGVIRLLGLATTIYLARVLSPDDYGALGLALAVVGFATVFVRAGTASRGTRMTARDPGAVPEIFAEITSLRLILALLMISLLILAAPWLAERLQIAPVLIVLCSLLLLRAALTVVWVFQGLDRMHVPAVADMAEKILLFAGLLLLVHGSGNDVLWAPVVELVAALIVMVGLYRQLIRLYGPVRLRFMPAAWRETSREALPLSLAAMLSSIYMNGGVLLLGWLSDTGSAALFLVAQKLVLTLVTLMVISNNAAFPTISRLMVHAREKAVALATRILRYFLVVTTPLFLLVAFHADFLVALLFGAEYREAASALVILLTAIPFMAAARTSRMLLMAIPKPVSVLASRFAGATVLLVLAFWLIPDHGTTGAAVALAAGEITSSFLMLTAVYRAAGRLPVDRLCLAPMLAGLASAAVYVFLDSWPPAGRMVAAAVVYTVLVFLLRGISMEEVRTMPGLFLPGGLTRIGKKQR